MKYVFVDFEMSTIGKNYTEQRKIWRQEIIEIGAVMLDESFSEVSSFKKFVKPDYARHINNTVYDLTGINDHHLNGCNGIEDELNAFAEWCLESGDDITIYAWSESDLNQVQKEYLLKEIEPSEALIRVMESWKDLQEEYDETVGSKAPTALHKALASIGVMFEGKMHDALDDSRNTARLFVEMRNPEEFMKTINLSHEYKDKENTGVTLGDLFDFSKLGFSA